jgi:putative ABC transport system permease protein
MMFKHFFKVAFRNALKQKIYSLINIAGLAMGLACFILIALFIRDELSYDRFHHHVDRIYRVFLEDYFNGEVTMKARGPVGAAPTLVREFPEVEKAAAVSRWLPAVRYEDTFIEYDESLIVDPDFFAIFTFPFSKGDPLTALAAPQTVVITESMAQKYFSDEDPIGKVLLVAGQSYKITGVAKDLPKNSHLKFNLAYSSLGPDGKLRYESIDWNRGAPYTYLLLSESASAAELEAKLPGYSSSAYDDIKKQLHLQPLTDIHLHSHLEDELSINSDIRYVYIFSLVAVLILSIAAINFVNLSTARASQRAKEVGMRKVLGAGRPQLVKQFLGESILFSFVALPIALTLVELFLPQFNARVDKNLALRYVSDLLVSFGLTLFVGIGAAQFYRSWRNREPKHE